MKIPKIGKDDRSKFVELDATEEVKVETSPAEIDAKRAAHSLERAAQLAERGDFAGAILATRQAIALNHDSVEAHGTLGQFLERSGDLKNAALSYEKAVELAPQSALERASLERVQERLRENTNVESFSFNDSELTDYSSETTPFDAGIKPNAALETPIEAKLPPTRAELEALAKQEDAKTEAKQPIATDSASVSAESEPNSVPVAAVLPPTSAEASGITASLPPTSAGVIADAMSARFSANSSVLTPKTPVEAQLPPTTSTVSPASLPLSAATPPVALNRRETGDRRKLNVPVPIDRRTQPDRRAAKLGNVPSPFVFQPVFAEPKAPLWAQFLRQPSFFGRTLPLVVVAVLSLGFLTWARARAVSQAALAPVVVADSGGIGPNNPVLTPPQAGNNVSPSVNPQPNTAPNPANDGFSISNNPVQQPQAGAVPAPGPVVNNPAPTTNNSAPAANPAPSNNRRPSTASAPRNRTPQFPAPSLEPAPIQPSAILDARNRSQGRNNSSGSVNLPQPQIDQRPAEAPVRVLPPDPSGVAAPLNPAGSSNRGYVRIRSGSLGAASAPSRPQNQANATEQAATNAARGGQTDAAIQGLTSAINNNNSSDAGFRFQQRASLFLERGDYSRAADDFQSAISAYQEQINRGENVSAARSGLRSARSGLNVALASRRNGN